MFNVKNVNKFNLKDFLKLNFNNFYNNKNIIKNNLIKNKKFLKLFLKIKSSFFFLLNGLILFKLLSKRFLSLF